jgi:hypothetical protein
MIALEDGGYHSASDYDEDTLALIASDEQCAAAPTEQDSEYKRSLNDTRGRPRDT